MIVESLDGFKSIYDEVNGRAWLDNCCDGDVPDKIPLGNPREAYTFFVLGNTGPTYCL